MIFTQIGNSISRCTPALQQTIRQKIYSARQFPVGDGPSFKAYGYTPRIFICPRMYPAGDVIAHIGCLSQPNIKSGRSFSIYRDTNIAGFQ